MTWKVQIPTVLGCLFVFSATLPTPPTILRSGTIIALQFVGNRIIIAADSRETLKLTDTAPFDDDACKITPLNKQMFFAGTGIQSSGLNTVKPFAANFAKDAFEKFRDTPNTESRNKQIADEWGELMREYFERVPDKDAAFAPVVTGDLADGIFGSNTTKGDLVVYKKTIYYAEPAPPLRSTGSKIVWASSSQKLEGDAASLLFFPDNEIMGEFVQSESKRALESRAKFENLLNKSTETDRYRITEMLLTFAIKTVESWDTTNSIGGPVDSLGLSSDGKMRWIHVKPACKGQIIQ